MSKIFERKWLFLFLIELNTKTLKSGNEFWLENLQYGAAACHSSGKLQCQKQGKVISKLERKLMTKIEVEMKSWRSKDLK
jgi:hypothetical protein